MAARLLDDERREDQVDTTDIQEEEHTEQVEEAVTQSTPEPEDDLPEKYKGKSAAELARMHQEAEKLLGRQSSEVGELRKVVDSYIQTQLAEKQAPQYQEDDDDVDFFTDPDKAVAKAIERHPKLRQAEEVTQQYQRQLAMAELNKEHPDAQTILQDEKFAAWVKASKIRTKLFIDADQKYDYDAANELFSLWKERQTVIKQTADIEKAERKQQVKAASTGNARGNPDSNARKIYRRADIIKLMKTDPDRYMAMADEIQKAYQEGRVKS